MIKDIILTLVEVRKSLGTGEAADTAIAGIIDDGFALLPQGTFPVEICNFPFVKDFDLTKAEIRLFAGDFDKRIKQYVIDISTTG